MTAPHLATTSPRSGALPRNARGSDGWVGGALDGRTVGLVLILWLATTMGALAADGIDVALLTRTYPQTQALVSSLSRANASSAGLPRDEYARAIQGTGPEPTTAANYGARVAFLKLLASSSALLNYAVVSGDGAGVQQTISQLPASPDELDIQEVETLFSGLQLRASKSAVPVTRASGSPVGPARTGSTPAVVPLGMLVVGIVIGAAVAVLLTRKPAPDAPEYSGSGTRSRRPAGARPGAGATVVNAPTAPGPRGDPTEALPPGAARDETMQLRPPPAPRPKPAPVPVKATPAPAVPTPPLPVDEPEAPVVLSPLVDPDAPAVADAPFPPHLPRNWPPRPTTGQSPLPFNPAPGELEDLVPDHYKIIGLLGRGGMGVVYRARDLRTQRQVAIKTLTQQGMEDFYTKERFRREYDALLNLSHPNIIQVHELGSLKLPYFVMELVEGEDLGSLVLDCELGLPQILDVAVQLVNALDHSHRKGIYHRDIKPSNLMLLPDGLLKVVDFGLAKDIQASRLTSTGTVLGTFRFMAPEQLLAEKVDGRVDLYAVGSTLYYLLAGTTPYEGQPPMAKLNKAAPPVEKLVPGLPAALSTAVNRCLLRGPDLRYPTARELEEVLRSCL